MGYDAVAERLPVQALFELRGPQQALAAWCGGTLPGFPEGPNRRTEAAGMTLAHLGPDRWLLRAALEAEAGLETALRPAEAPPEISVVRVSDTLAVFRITGAEAPDVMAIGCPLDLHPSAFGADAASYTDVFGLKALMMRCPGGFDLGVEQSFGPMVADYLARALA